MHVPPSPLWGSGWGGAETAKKLNTFANKDLKKQTETFDNLNQFAHSLVDLT